MIETGVRQTHNMCVCVCHIQNPYFLRKTIKNKFLADARIRSDLRIRKKIND